MPDGIFQERFWKATEDERADQDTATNEVPTVYTERNDAKPYKSATVAMPRKNGPVA